LLKLSELSRKLEEKHGVAQDIEWAIVGDDIFLLQSRPVTTM
jgi:phosphoenolpyruvate synthase/pyruvate phosphate dikinase